MTTAPIGFRVVGATENRREVVSYRKAMLAYCHADPAVQPALPAFLSAFAFPVAFRDHVAATGSTRAYAGPVGVPALNFDLDRTDPAAALSDARRLSYYLADRYACDIVVAFSGGKGYHVSVPTGGFIAPSPAAHRVAGALAVRLAGEVGVDIDTGFYDAVRLWRAPNSRHSRSGLHKVRLDLDDLLYLDPAGVRRLAVDPIPYDPPFAQAPPLRLVDDWREAARQVDRDDQARCERHAGAPRGGRINPSTRLLLTDPTAVAVGERHKVVFSAAADLAGFGTVEALVAALVTDPALDTGLPPGEVARQIACGIHHGRPPGEGGAV
ncbi:hypothetical protein [Paludisphaera soli]|uniref:hypothetical protein n=1 Tax=Paludisphaera soli TaxID=2712865 RepID=UPI0013EA18B3|nr:hypothetical protein [Paludisphaera soli]